jgi:hypothetical protein
MAKILISKRVICFHYKSVIRILAIRTPGSVRSMRAALDKQNILHSKLRKLNWKLYISAPIACKVHAIDDGLHKIACKIVRVHKFDDSYLLINKIYFWQLYILLRRVKITATRVW